MQRRTPPGERFYGFGEKTGPLDKRGRSMTFFNTDPFDDRYGGWAPEADPLYLSIPFFIGLREKVAYGLFTDNPAKLLFDMAAASPTAYRISAAAGPVDQYLLAGPSMAEVVRRFAFLTGRMPLPPRWALGYHQSRWGYFPDSEVVEICAQLRRRGIPADGLYLDIQHQDGYRQLTWDKKGFANPREFLESLEAMGFKASVIVDPCIKVNPQWEVYKDGLRKGYYLKTADGTAHVDEVWPGHSVFPDFTNPDVRAWWAGLMRQETDLGVRGIWLDMNEPATFRKDRGRTLPDSLAARGEGRPATFGEVHNAWALQEAKATFEGMKAAQPARRPFLLTRAGYAGIQRYSAVWTGDCPSSWQALQQTLPMLLNLGLSGVPFVGSDVGGFSGKATSDLYARWMQVGALSPFFRVHTSMKGNRQEPWQFGPHVEGLSRSIIAERYKLLAYLYSLAHHASLTGEPILRPLVYAFQDDPATHALGDQALLGPFLMAAPVMEKGATTRRVYLPAGRWFDFWSGTALEGPASVDLEVSLGSLPLFVRAGAILPTVEPLAWSDSEPHRSLYFDLYPSELESTFALYEDDGDGFAHEDGVFSRVEYVLRPEGGTLRFFPGARTGSRDAGPRRLSVRLWDAARFHRVSLSGRELPLVPPDTSLSKLTEGWSRAADGGRIVVAFPESSDWELRFLA
ncbi:MAG: glycoside hydrolase family 31 protein [Myxococcales bacterium]